MAREYTIVEIDGVTYELHGVKADKKPIGSVPVRAFTGDDGGVEEFSLFIGNISAGDMVLVIADYKYGLAVRLQGMARKCVSGEGFSDAAMNKTYNTLTKDECLQFQGDHTALVKYCKQKWAEMQAEGANDVDADKVWEELL